MSSVNLTAEGAQTRGAATSPQGDLPPHHVPPGSKESGKYTNPWSSWQERSFSDVWRWQRSDTRRTRPYLIGNDKPSQQDWRRAFPLNPVNWQPLQTPSSGQDVQAVFVGHATVLVQMEGLTFLTDPLFSQRCSPVQFLGPKRVVDVPFQIEDPQLPKIDFVLLSHNHYDHLDSGSVQRLHKRYGDELTWYVPLGLKTWFRSAGVNNVVELDWWQEVQHADTKVRIAMVPAQHWSGRYGLDRRATLWGGFAVVGPHTRFFFAGDTGYCDVFKEIGARYGPFDLAAIPTGAYEPRWFMKPQHVDVDEAVLVHRDVRARVSVAIHCCTFCLTDEALDEPPHRLQALTQGGGKGGQAGTPDPSQAGEAAAAAAAAVPLLQPMEFVTLQHGELIQVREGKVLNTPKLLPVKM